uniref:Dynein heavy chain C-terminal domain-containing protein n=1 Tax=Laticauda laticaudata TaxID=8630 RepID=A0A8C5S7R5_LATLA
MKQIHSARALSAACLRRLSRSTRASGVRPCNNFEKAHFLGPITFSPSYCGEEDQLLYKCPLYKTPQRTGMLSSMGQSINFVTEVNLPSLVTPSHWIMRGVALLCQLDD